MSQLQPKPQSVLAERTNTPNQSNLNSKIHDISLTFNEFQLDLQEEKQSVIVSVSRCSQLSSFCPKLGSCSFLEEWNKPAGDWDLQSTYWRPKSLVRSRTARVEVCSWD